MDKQSNQNADKTTQHDQHTGKIGHFEKQVLGSSPSEDQILEEHILQTIVEDSGKLFFAVDRTLQIFYANSLFLEYFDLEENDISKISIEKISFPDNMLQNLKENLEDIFCGNDGLQSSFKSSGYRENEYFKVKIIPLTFYELSVESVVVILEDISVQQLSTVRSSRLREQLKKMITERTIQLEESNSALHREIIKSEAARKQSAKSQEILNTIFNAIHDRLAVIDRDYRIINSNHQQEGESEAGEQRYCFIELMGQTKPCEDCILKDVFNTGQKRNIEIVSCQKVPYAVNVFPIKDENEVVKYIVAHYRDISAEKANEVSSNLLRKAQQVGRIGYWTYSYESAEMYWSEEFYDILGISDKSITPSLEHIEASIHPDEKDLVLPVISSLFTNSRINNFEFRFLKQDGSECHAYALKDQIYNQDNKATGIIGVIQDISTRVRNEQKIRRSRQQWRDLFDQSPDGIYIRKDHNFKMVNTSLENLFNYNREFFYEKGNKYLELVADEDKNEIAGILRYKQEKGDRPTVFTFTGVTNDNRRVDCEVKESVVEWKDEEVVMGFVRDITSVKRLEGELRQSQKMESIGKLAGCIAHDFNNLLTIISGIADLAIYEYGEELPVYEEMNEILKTTSRAQELTKGLLGFSRKQPIKPVVLDLNVALENMEKMLNKVIRESIMLRFVKPKMIKSIKADPGQIEQIIVNLTVNSSDAIEQGGIITIKTADVYLNEDFVANHKGSRIGNFVLLCVSDNGKGMSAEILEKIFEPFYTTKDVGKGTGLGMATVYGIVKQNEGYIDVISQPGEGTTVSIYFPAVEGKTSSSSKRVAIEKEKNLKGNETILIIEDELSVRKLTIKAFKHYGYNAIGAQDVFDAYNIANTHSSNIDLILTDVIMPGMNGPEIAQKISEIHPESKILFMSGYTDNDIIHHGVFSKEFDFIPKPFKPADLVKKARRILDKKNA